MPDPATTQKQIVTELSSRQVTLSAGQTMAVFNATVYNDSDQFASFQLKLLAAGATGGTSKPWYRLTPSVSSKIPAGDSTRFQVEIFDLPSIAQEFQGSIDLTVEVTSRELYNQYDRQSLRLLATGLQGKPPDLSLLMPTLQAFPGDRVEIVGQVYNSTAIPTEAVLRLTGLPDRWFPDGVQQLLPLPSGKLQKVTFECEIPAPTQALSQVYPLQLEATGRFPTAIAAGELHILPAGERFFTCDPLECAIPEQLGRWQNPTQGVAQFTLQFNNLSNLEPMAQVRVRQLSKHRRWFWQKELLPAEPVFALPPGVALELPNPLPIGLSPTSLQIHRRLPWLGWARLQWFEVKAETGDTIPFQPETQTLQVHVFPVIPLWLQLLGALLALGFGALLLALLTDPGHRGPVNSVQFSGQGTEVLSGSDDQTIRRWRVQDQSLTTQNRIGNLDKAIRVVRYRPVNNDQAAIGFENGEIQLANLLTGRRSRLIADKDDRVFDLVFSRDARTLYSGHGSGLVLQWDTRPILEQTAPQRAYDTKFAIEAMALVGNDDSHLAIGGRYNRLLILETKKNASTAKTAQFLEVPYPSGSSTDYISSLSAADQQPNLLVIGDTQGRISLWDAQTCLKNQGRCGSIEPPWLAHGGSPLRSVALSFDGCFVASAADDGEVKLWALDGQGLRRSSVREGRVLTRSRKPINAVDLIQDRDSIWVTSGGDDGEVRLHRVQLGGDGRMIDRCPVLAGDGL
ncbi:hypothetical protein JOY44_23695 [Phormidium sp. CLA17]|uniref:hypothetical protein n=1 Tax=Leptolyngbya sp. Cla-17 TaxID=2803751 RepID=UPI0014932478|nr:hypothetical protein [Leptolyngbya sp. Cla-17]MBM0744574.1 hypothetical protein [Leptolyngbya sp. Cla-17]